MEPLSNSKCKLVAMGVIFGSVVGVVGVGGVGGVEVWCWVFTKK